MTTRMTIKADGGGVGIGTTSPSVKLAVDGEASFGDGSKLTMIGLDINSGVTPNFIKIRTKIPFASGAADFTINIKGFRYGSAETTSLMVCWHYYNSTFYSPALTSSGSFAPTVKLSAEDWDSSGTAKVCIVLVSPGYWPKLYVESMYSSAYNDAYADGWDWVDADATGPGNNLATLSYKSNFGNSFVMLSNGNVGIGTTGPSRKLDVNGDANIGTNLVVGSGIYNANYYAGSSTATYFKNSVGADTLTILQGGSVGIGTTSPTQKLHLNSGVLRISGGGNDSTGEINLDNGTQYSGNSFQIRKESTAYWGVKSVTSGNDLAVFVDNNVNLGLYIKNGSGNVGIGTTAPADKLDVVGTVRTDKLRSNGVVYLGITGTKSSNATSFNMFDINNTGGSQTIEIVLSHHHSGGGQHGSFRRVILALNSYTDLIVLEDTSTNFGGGLGFTITRTSATTIRIGWLGATAFSSGYSFIGWVKGNGDYTITNVGMDTLDGA